MEILYFDLAGTTWEWLEVKCLAPSLVIELAAFAVAAEILNRQTVKAYNSLLFSCCTENSLESLSVSVCIVQYCSFFLFRKWNLILTHNCHNLYLKNSFISKYLFASFSNSSLFTWIYRLWGKTGYIYIYLLSFFDFLMY